MPVILSEPLALRILRELDRSFYGLTSHKSEEELCALWGLMQGLRRAIKEADEATGGRKRRGRKDRGGGGGRKGPRAARKA